MTIEDGSEATADEQALADIVRELEAAREAPDVEALVRLHPQLEREIRGLIEVRRALEASSPVGAAPPARLGEFRIERCIASGGMGDVYEAWQEPLKRRVAIKVLRRGRHTAVARDRFLREQQVLARLHQTNILPIHVAGRDVEDEYFVMPYVDGASLRSIIASAQAAASVAAGARMPDFAELVRQARSRSGTGRDIDGRPASRAEAAALRPSPEYLRSAVALMADAAMAVQHAHDQGVLHRDIKPSNILVEVEDPEERHTGQCWVIDFGLAAYAGRQSDDDESAHPLVSGVMGTPGYMAPEQFDQHADERTDVWGLGTTLYELLTLQRAFPDSGGGERERVTALRERILKDEPSAVRGRIPRDLEAIALKALQKDPQHRYASARALSEDLRRWLADEPVVARCERSPVLAASLRVARWVRRHRGWAAAIVLVLGVSVYVPMVAYGRAEDRRRDAEREREAESRERVAAERARNIQELEAGSAQPHLPGWSDRARRLALETAQGGVDDALLAAYSSMFSGVDATRTAELPGHASWLAFDATGGELLAGGARAMGTETAQPARAWRGGKTTVALGAAVDGPVAYARDGSRRQFRSVGGNRFSLRELPSERELALVTLACDEASEVMPALGSLDHPLMDMAANATVVAAAVAGSEATPPGRTVGAVGAWDADTGRPLLRFAGLARALSLSRDGRWLIVALQDAHADIWDLRDGARVAHVPLGRDGVEALAFDADPADGAIESAIASMRLAVGFDSGQIDIWSVARSRIVAMCPGMLHGVHVLEFSSDGALLAAGGSGAMLWDAATGERLLDLPATVANALAFKPDDSALVIAEVPAFLGPGHVTVFGLQPHRGLRALRGLNAAVHVVALSRDGDRAAAVAGDWLVGVWNTRLDEPCRTFEAPRGYVSDNVGLALSADGGRLACCAGTEARLWDVASGRMLQHWRLPAGLIDHLAFDDDGRVITARCEPVEPTLREPSRRHSIVRLRRLAEDGGMELLHESAEPWDRAICLVLDPRGQWLVVEGDRSREGHLERWLEALAVSDGRPLWTRLLPGKTDDESTVQADPTGRILEPLLRNKTAQVLLDMPGGEQLEGLSETRVLGVAGTYMVVTRAGDRAFYRPGEPEPAALLRGPGGPTIFDESGRWFAWGEPRGTVMLGDLDTVLRSRELLLAAARPSAGK